ncbi:MAG: heparinase II/III family protein [Victivallales bacterium]|nr:heparinase II/III family protein [Victivallales bacterium]
MKLRSLLTIMSTAFMAMAAEPPPVVITEFSNNVQYAPVKHPALFNFYKYSTESLKAKVAPIMELSEKELLDMLPIQAGIWFMSCPKKGCLNPQGSCFIWDIKQPDKLVCRTCKTVFPNKDYPITGETVATAPSGRKCHFPYYERDGWHYHIQAGIDYRKRDYFSEAARSLAILYYQTKEEQYGRRAALILLHFARHYGDICYKYDFPFAPNTFRNGVPALNDMEPHGRISRFTWWYYMDIPRWCIVAYDFLMTNPKLMQSIADEYGENFQELVQTRFLEQAAKDVLRVEERYTNMGPNVWICLMELARVTGNSDYFHISLRRTEYFLRTKFFPDGFWSEASDSYHRQSYGSIRYIVNRAKGFSAPDGPLSIYATQRITNYDPAWFAQFIALSDKRARQLRMPKGLLSLNDTGVDDAVLTGDDKEELIRESYLMPNVGIAKMFAGTVENPILWYSEFTTKYGHNHNDLLNVSLFANHRQALSDLGYTHSHLRPYTTGTPQHNLVVVDLKCQQVPREGGRLLFAELQNPTCKIVDMDAPNAYPELKEYSRCDFLVSVGNTGYVVDFFTVAGETSTLDFFFHGDAWKEDDVTMSANGKQLAFKPDDLLSKEMRAAWKSATKESDWDLLRQPGHNYGYFSDISSSKWNCKNETLTVDFNNPDGTLLRLLFPPHPDLSLKPFIGRGPSLNQASKDSSAIGKYFRRFACLRHTGPISKKARFHCLLEFQPDLVKGIQMLAPNIMAIALENRLDILFKDQSYAQDFSLASNLSCARGFSLAGKVTLQGSYGFLSLDSKGNLLDAYVAGGSISIDGKTMISTPAPLRTQILSADAEYTLELEEELNLPQGAFIKILFPEQQQTRGNYVIACKDKTLTLKERTGLIRTPENGWKWDSFPRTAIPGELFIEHTPVSHFTLENKK